MTNDEQIRRADAARQILEHSLWIEAWAAFRQKMLDDIEQASTDEVERILECKRMLVAATAARSTLEYVIQNGKVALETAKLAKERKHWFT